MCLLRLGAGLILSLVLAACRDGHEKVQFNLKAPPSKKDACLSKGPDEITDDKVGVWIPAQTLTVGSEEHSAEEGPRVVVSVAGFWIDSTEVTNADFAKFVDATGYLTVAERDGAGGGVFEGAWHLEETASWRQPFGHHREDARPDFPVVQIAYEDALAYARWLGRDLPTEIEWEAAARGGIQNAIYTWGNEARGADGKPQTNHWQGIFPIVDTGDDGFEGLAPVACFPANGYGLYDMAGNVWEWTQDPWSDRRQTVTVAAAATREDAARVIKGGSWLCADNFCHRYRPASRQLGDPSIGTIHIGFRTVLRPRNSS